MMCATCARTIEDAVLSIDGVFSATVNLATEKVFVRFDPDMTDVDAIKVAIVNAGYNVLESGSVDTELKEMQKEEKERADILIFSISLSAVLIFIMVSFDYFGLGAILGIASLEGLILFIIATPIQFIAGGQFYTGTYHSITNGRANMDALIAIGSTAAYLYSTIVVFFPSYFPFHQTFFDTSAMIITLILLGKFLESKAKGRTSEAIKKLMGLQVSTAHVIRDGDEIEVSIGSLLVDDIFIVRPGERIPSDGVVMDGASAVDESMISGESAPIEKSAGSRLLGGSVNKNGVLRAKATKVGKDTVLAQIIRLVEDAQASKAPIQRIADKVSSWFVPMVISIATASFLIWYLFAFSALGVSGDVLAFSISIFIAVLVISCPCALGLATPTAIMVGSGKGAENGILFKTGEALETAGKVKVVILDKTGTLTEGKPEVTDIIHRTISDKELLRIAAAVERYSEHPLGQAVVRKARTDELIFLRLLILRTSLGRV